MRPALLIQGLIALILGSVLGIGFLFGSGQLRAPSQVAALRSELDATRRSVAERKAAAADAEAAARAAEAERLAAEQQALAEQQARDEADAAARAAEEERLAAERAARSQQNQQATRSSSAYGILTIRAQSPLTAVSEGKSMFGKGLDLPFSKAPGKITLKDGRFTINLTTKIVGSRLMVDVTVSPMAIVSAQGERLGTSAHGLQVGKSSFALGFNSPTAGDLNLVLQYKN